MLRRQPHIISEKLYGQCRCCLKYASVRYMWEKYKDAGTDVEVYGKMLVDCYAISWTILETAEEDKICENCVMKLRQAMSFKLEVLKSQEALLIVHQAKHPEQQQDDQDTIVIEETTKKKRKIAKKTTPKPPKEKTPKPLREKTIKPPKDEAKIPETPKKKPGAPKKPQFNFVIPVIADNNSLEIPLMRKDDPELYEIPFIRRKIYETETVPRPIIIKKEQEIQTDLDYVVPENEMLEPIGEDPTYEQVEFLDEVLEVPAANEKVIVEENETSLKPMKDLILQHRENIRSILLISNATPIRGYWGKGYTCCFCSAQFPSPSNLKQHTFTHEDTPFKFKARNLFEHIVKLDITNLKCNICDVNMKSLKYLMKHIITVHQMPMHMDIPNHIVPFSFDSDTLKCIECSKEFDSFKDLSEHMTDEHYRNYECADPSCGKGFINFQSLKTHSISHGVFMVASSVCGKVFGTKQDILEHERQHQRDINMKCSYANEEFNEEVKLKIKQMNAQRVICANCPEMFNSTQELMEHVKTVHIEHKYKCSECDRSFFLKQGLKNHMIQEHTQNELRQCPLCPVVCNSLARMKEHMLTHSVENNYKFQCEVCQLKFQLEANYMKHMSTEHGLVQ